jgi:nuclear pore complex protein Nup93
MGLARDIAQLDTAATFQPLQPLADNDVQGYLRHVHEQTLISTIEESRRETQDEFYRVMEERVRRDWEAQKKLIFEELGGRSISLAERTNTADLRKSVKSLSISSSPASFAPTLEVHNKMTAYEKVVSELNAARLKGSSYPILHGFMDAAKRLNTDVSVVLFCFKKTLDRCN